MKESQRSKRMIKKGLFMTGIIILFTGFQIKNAYAEDVEINETNFPDPVFREWVSEEVDIETKDGILSDSERSIKRISFYKMGVTNLKGVEFFPELEVLYCPDNQLISLDVSKNTALQRLDCYDNQLISLDVSKNTALTELFCSVNQLSSLDVSKNTALVHLYCNDNQLGSLDVSKNIELDKLGCERNYFSFVDITGLNNLKTYDGTREGNVLRVTAKERTVDQSEKDNSGKAQANSCSVGDMVLSKNLKAQKGNEAILENSSFTITTVSSDGKTPGTVAFDGVEEENAAAVTIPKTIYIDGVPYNVTTVSPKAFENSAENAGYKVTDNQVDNLTVEYVGQVDAKKTKKTVNVPEYSNYRGIRFKVTSIAAKSFRKNTKVTKVKIASSITVIGANCFEGCSKLQQVVVGKGLREIGKNAFKNCKKLTLIQLKGTKLKKVGKAALKGVNAKCKIKVPKAKVKAYTKLFKSKGQKKSVKVVKA